MSSQLFDDLRRCLIKVALSVMWQELFIGSLPIKTKAFYLVNLPWWLEVSPPPPPAPNPPSGSKKGSYLRLIDCCITQL